VSTPDTCPSCSAGCFCPSGLFEFGVVCLPQESCPDTDFDEIPLVDKCSGYSNCSECISSDPDCQWCPYEPGETSVIGSRCRLRGENPLCPVEIQDPQPNITELENEDFGDTVQRRPQKLKLQLRRGQPKNFTLRFRAARNFPLDVYFLLDVTGSFSQRFRTTVTPLAADLLAALSDISEQYAVAFGGFADKRAIPYSFPSQDPMTYQETAAMSTDYVCTDRSISNLADCNPTISFRHTTNFSQLEGDQLTEVLENISIHLNVDGLEGGMDGLVQVLTCSEQVGWREESLRMLLYMSNAAFHLAGDGKVGAILDPNPGECLLRTVTEEGMTFNEYSDDTRYDYPSVYQLGELARTSETNIVFAVTSEDANDPNALSEVYQDLADKITPFGRVVALETNSSNLISVIQEAYNAISQEVVLSLQQFYPGLDFKFTPGEGCSRADEGRCTNVTIGNTVSYTVTVNLTSCENVPKEAVLTSPAFGNVKLLIKALCDCDCNQEIVNNSEKCGGVGNLQCGQCQCPDGWSGEMCECEVPEGEDPPTCATEDGEPECSGPSQGYCDCGTCKCFVQQELLRENNFTEVYFGDNCECDYKSCGGNLTSEGKLCSGNGECVCSERQCRCFTEPTTQITYGGTICECDPRICYSEEHQDVCVYTGSLSNLPNADTRAPCDSCNGTCLCRAGTVPGPDGTCDPQPDLCLVNEECARCAKDLQSEGTDCNMPGGQTCNAELFDDNEEKSGELCTFIDDENCVHTFYVQLSKTLVDQMRVCSASDEGIGSQLVWIIPVAVIAALLLLGGLILLLVLLLVCIKDRMEYSQFKQDLEDANWDQQENPMYVSPHTQYSNVTYRPKSAKTAQKE
jgi:hypothetical protein